MRAEAAARSPAFVALILGQLCLTASSAGLRMAAPLSLLRSGQSEVVVGPLLAAFAAGTVLSALPAGRLSDRRGYHLPARIAVFLCLLAGLTALAARALGSSGYVVICLAGACAGAGANTGLITIQRSAGKSARDAAEMKRFFSWLGVAPALSNFAGPLLAGVLIDHYGFGVAFAALACLPFGTLLASTFVPSEPTGAARPVRQGGRFWDLLSGKLLRRLLLVNWFMSASWDVHTFLVPVLGHERGLSASALGSVLGAFALAVAAVRLAMPWLSARAEDAHVLMVSLMFVASAFASYPFARRAGWMVACATLLGLGLGAAQPIVLTSLHRITPPQRHGEALGLRSLVMNTSSALLPLGFGLAGAALGAVALFWFMAGLTASGVLVARSLGRVEARESARGQDLA
jgi:MFS family permease